eukprot:tig00000555_g2150.t1
MCRGVLNATSTFAKKGGRRAEAGPRPAAREPLLLTGLASGQQDNRFVACGAGREHRSGRRHATRPREAHRGALQLTPREPPPAAVPVLALAAVPVAKAMEEAVAAEEVAAAPKRGRGRPRGSRSSSRASPPGSKTTEAIEEEPRSVSINGDGAGLAERLHR